jgi:hypothetical protein
MKIVDLKQFLDKTVTLRMKDGEVAKVRVVFICEEDEDIIADVLHTTRPDNYRDTSAAYTFSAADIISVEISN